jgi:hypothetical protein
MSLQVRPKNPLICNLVKEMPTLNFLGLKNYPKLPDPQIYSKPAESRAPE